MMKPAPVSNRQLTLLRKLNQKKYREKEKLFFIEGARAVQQVITNASVKVKELYFDEAQLYWQQETWSTIVHDYSNSVIGESDFIDVSDTDNPQGVFALCVIPEEASTEDMMQQKGVILATDRIQDPGNLGTIIRTACWFGAKGLLSGKGTVDLFNPKVVRSTAGATGTLAYKNGSLSELLPHFEQEGWQVLLLDGSDGARDIKKIDAPDKSILIIGNEANGIDANLLKEDRVRLRIPCQDNHKDVESLNAGIAAGIALYELNK